MKIAAVSALALAVAAFGTANAQDAPQPPQTIIAYADLNLRSTADANLMLGRIRNAAAEVCRASPMAEGMSHSEIVVRDDCFRQAVQRAVAQLNAPKVTAAFEARADRLKLARAQ